MRAILKQNPIPSHWEWKKAQEHIDIRDGTHDSPKPVSEGYPLVTSKNLVNGRIDFSTCSYISKEDHDSISKRSAVDSGDILYAMIGTIGNPVIVYKHQEFSIKNVALFKFRNSDILNKYFYYFLGSDLTKRQFENKSRGGTQKFVSLKNIRELILPLPPLTEQQKIAEILDAADALRQKDQQLIAHYEQLGQSLFLEMFGDPVVNPKGWEVKSLSDITLKITDGEHQNPPLTDSGFHLIMAKNVLSDTVSFDNPKYVSPENYSKYIRKCNPEKGDVLLVSRGATVGRCTIVRTCKPFCLMGSVILVKVGQSMLGSYLAHIFKHKNFSKKLVNVSSASAQQAIYISHLKKLKLPLPPIHLQNQFANRITAIEAQKQQAQQNLEQSEKLFNSLLQRAFKGELTV